MRRQRECLRGVAGIHLPERHGHHACAAGRCRMAIHALDAWYPHAIQVIEYARGSHQRIVLAEFAARVVRHDRRREYRLLAEMHRLHLDDRIVLGATAVEAVKFSERSLGAHVARMDEPFDDDLGAGRDWQVDVFGVGQLDRVAHDAAGRVDLRLMRPEALRAHHEEHRVDPERGHDLGRLALRPGRFAVGETVPSRNAVEADAPLVEELLAVDADIDATALRGPRQRDAAGADERTAVGGPEFRRREFGQVDLVAAPYHLVDRRFILRDVDRRNPALHQLAGRLHHVGERHRRINADRERITLLACAQDVGENARIERIVRKPLEQQGWGRWLRGRHQGDCSKLLVRIDLGRDAPERAEILDQREPFAQIAPAAGPAFSGDGRRRGGRGRLHGIVFHFARSN